MPQLTPFIPAKIYPNAEADKAQILSDNQNKAGIYMWKNLTNDKCYIGSAVNLPNRLAFYYSFKTIINSLKNSKSHIYNAILKHGHSNFSFTILEYCEPSREGFYLKKFNPEYNISLNPSAPMSGRKHSDESKQIMSDAAKKMDNSGCYKPGQPKTEGSGRPSQQIEVTDIKNNTTTSYNSISEAGRALNINESSIRYHLKSNSKKPFKGQYTLKKI